MANEQATEARNSFSASKEEREANEGKKASVSKATSSSQKSKQATLDTKEEKNTVVPSSPEHSKQHQNHRIRWQTSTRSQRANAILSQRDGKIAGILP